MSSPDKWSESFQITRQVSGSIIDQLGDAIEELTSDYTGVEVFRPVSQSAGIELPASRKDAEMLVIANWEISANRHLLGHLNRKMMYECLGELGIGSNPSDSWKSRPAAIATPTIRKERAKGVKVLRVGLDPEDEKEQAEQRAMIREALAKLAGISAGQLEWSGKPRRFNIARFPGTIPTVTLNRIKYSAEILIGHNPDVILGKAKTLPRHP